VVIVWSRERFSKQACEQSTRWLGAGNIGSFCYSIDLLLQFHWRFFIVHLHIFSIGKSLALFREQFTLYDLDV
jgi:hypothetical protein